MPRALSDQVIVLLGATSGVGRETAALLAREGSTVVLAGRGEEALQAAADEVQRLGGRAAVVRTDAADWVQVQQLAQRAVEEFGRIDTWINLPAVAVYGTVDQLDMTDIRRVIDVTLYGQIHGMKAATEQMRRQGAGTVINVSSALAKRSVPLQSAYCAAKHGVVGFSESLRLELARDAPDVHLCDVLPSSINTPLFEHARSKLGVLPSPIPPIYEPVVVARTLLALAQQPQREVVVGSGGKGLLLAQRLSPRLVDWYMLGPGKAFDKQRSDQPDNGTDNLDGPFAGPGRPTGQFGKHSKSTSLVTEQLQLRPQRTRVLLGGVLAVAAAVLTVARRGRTA